MIINKNRSFFQNEMTLKLKLMAIALLFCSFNQNIIGQSDTILIKTTIQNMFQAMANLDSSSLKMNFAPEMTLKSISKNKVGETITKEESSSQFLKIVGTKHEGLKLDERILSFQILIDDNMAMVWTPYKFYLNDTFSHCGVNLFTMVKIKDEWKILAIVDTRRKTDCD
jgi:hypothetical protein